MSGVQQTSLLAYADALPTLGEKQKAVYRSLVDHGPGTNLEISFRLHRPINTITPRMHELVRLGVVRELYKGICRHSGRKAIVWVAVPEKIETLAML